MIRVGIDLGGTNIAAGAVDKNCRILAKYALPTLPERGAAAVISDMAAAVSAVLAQAGYSLDACVSVGVGCPGSCDARSGTVSRAHNLGWDSVPVVESLRTRLHRPVFLGNDGNCAALGETLAGAAKGRRNVVMITLGTGIGCGLVIGGKLYAGTGALGAEAGHTLLIYDGERCTCGRRGCWEAYASATALIRQASEAARNDPRSLLNTGRPLTALDIFSVSREGDRTAQKVIDRYISYLSAGLTDLVNLFYPEILLLGGGISAQGEFLLAPLRAYIAENAFCRGDRSLPPVAIATLGNDAGIIGAAMLDKYA